MNAVISAGKLDRRITIERFTTTANAFNELVEDWAPLVEVWAEARPVRGSERFRAVEVAGGAVTTFKIRWRDGITVKDRIAYDGRTWDIHDVRELGRRVGLEIDAIARSDRDAEG